MLVTGPTGVRGIINLLRLVRK